MVLWPLLEVRQIGAVILQMSEWVFALPSQFSESGEHNLFLVCYSFLILRVGVTTSKLRLCCWNHTSPDLFSASVEIDVLKKTY